MTYSLRAAILHGLLLLLSTVAFVLPVVADTRALLSIPLAAGTAIILAVLMLVDSSRHAFSPPPNALPVACECYPYWPPWHSSRAGCCG